MDLNHIMSLSTSTNNSLEFRKLFNQSVLTARISRSYYVTTGYGSTTEYSIVQDTRYVVEQPNYYSNGSAYPSTSNAYPQVAYAPHGAPPGVVYSTTAPFDQRSLGQRQFVDAKGYPIGNRSVVQIVDMKATEIPQPAPNNTKAAGKSAKKRSAPVPTHTITSVPIGKLL